MIPLQIPIYLYTNGVLLERGDLIGMKGVNIGIHLPRQVDYILDKYPYLIELDSVRWCVDETRIEELASRIPKDKLHPWKMNDCMNNVDSEDWVVLKEAKQCTTKVQ